MNPFVGPEEGERMAQCEVCHNQYDKTFQVVADGATHVFDSFECAIQALAPTCAHCGCRVIGPGVEGNGVGVLGMRPTPPAEATPRAYGAKIDGLPQLDSSGLYYCGE